MREQRLTADRDIVTVAQFRCASLCSGLRSYYSAAVTIPMVTAIAVAVAPRPPQGAGTDGRGPRSRMTPARARMGSLSASLRHTSAYDSGSISVTGR